MLSYLSACSFFASYLLKYIPDSIHILPHCMCILDRQHVFFSAMVTFTWALVCPSLYDPKISTHICQIQWILDKITHDRTALFILLTVGHQRANGHQIRVSLILRLEHFEPLPLIMTPRFVKLAFLFLLTSCRENLAS